MTKKDLTENAPTIPESMVTEATAIVEKASSLRDMIKVGSLSLAQGLGMAQAFTFIRDFTDIARLKWLKERKELKDYKGLSIPDKNGNLKALRSFEDLCACMGVSYSKVSEDLKNLATFGETFMQSSAKIGLGYRDLRKLRALPEADIKALEGTDDPDELKSLADDLLRENHELKKKVKERDDNLVAREQVLTEKGKALDAARSELAKIKNLSPDQRVIERGKAEAKLIERLDAKCYALIGMLDELLGTAARLLESESPNTALYPHTRITALCDELAAHIESAGINADLRNAISGEDWRGGERDTGAVTADGDENL